MYLKPNYLALLVDQLAQRVRLHPWHHQGLLDHFLQRHRVDQSGRRVQVGHVAQLGHWVLKVPLVQAVQFLLSPLAVLEAQLDPQNLGNSG